MDSYLEGWRWGDPQERSGGAEDVATAVVKELDAANPRTKLMNPEQT